MLAVASSLENDTVKFDLGKYLRIVSLAVRDVKAAKTFYVKKLGFKLLEEQKDFVQVQCGPIQLCLDHEEDVHEGVAIRTEPRLLFQVGDLRSLHEKLDRAGLSPSVIQGAPGRHWFAIQDPDHHELVFSESL